jgi:hypothetical protein
MGNIGEGFVGEPAAYLKPIAAGQVVVTSKDSDVAKRIKLHYNDATAVEMESAGMYMAAQRADRPALAIRGISDLLDDKSAEADADRQPLASEHAAAFTFALLRAIESDDLRERATPTAPVPGPDDLLARVPPNVVTELEKVRSDSSAGAEVLLRRLASDTESPVELVNRLVNDPPEWLVGSTSARLWAVVGEYAAAYDAREATARAFVHAAEKDDAEPPVGWRGPHSLLQAMIR